MSQLVILVLVNARVQMTQFEPPVLVAGGLHVAVFAPQLFQLIVNDLEQVFDVGVEGVVHEDLTDGLHVPGTQLCISVGAITGKCREGDEHVLCVAHYLARRDAVALYAVLSRPAVYRRNLDTHVRIVAPADLKQEDLRLVHQRRAISIVELF